MTEAQIATMVLVLKALADESRLRILSLLASEERSVDELASRLNLRGPTVSHHLAKLREVGLVSVRTEGTTHNYRLNSERLRGLGEELFAPERLATEDTDQDARWERKVLYNYFEGDRLTEIPASRKKRDVILRWLAERFPVGERLPESAVNELIGRHHPDFATLRRELIGAGLLRREAGVYWREAPAAAV